MKKLLIVFSFLFALVCTTEAQYTTLNAHSHNDYAQKTPFFLAYNAGFGSMEADIWAVDGELLVAHDRKDLKPERTIEALYLDPIIEAFKKNGGKPWKNLPASFQLLVDIKTEVEPALSMLAAKAGKYPDVFDPAINKYAVKIVITGNRPDPALFDQYPAFIYFDGKLNLRYTEKQLKRVPLYSENLKVFTPWNSNDPIPELEEARLKHVIDSVHSLNRKIRWWNAPDNQAAWIKLENLKVDYINTDHIAELAGFLNSGK